MRISRFRSPLKPALLVAALAFTAPSQALVNTPNYSGTGFWTNWTEGAVESNTATYLKVEGHGQWFCYRGNGNSNNYTEYDAHIRVYDRVEASLQPNWEVDCSGNLTNRYRWFSLRLHTLKVVNGLWATHSDQTVAWQGQWGIHGKYLYDYTIHDGAIWNTSAYTTVEGKATLTGTIAFTDN